MAATITAGTTTVLASTALPTVTNTGTSSAAIFNFGIPAGSAGSNGTNGTSGISGVISVVAPITNTGTSSSAILGITQSALSLTRSQISDFTSGTVASATTSGTATYATTSGTAVYATTSGTSVSISGSITKSQVSDFTSGTVASAIIAGTATYATTSGTAVSISGSITKNQVSDFTSGTVTTISGSITKSQVSDFTSGTVASATIAGTATYATTSGTATYATTSGTATYATTSGTSVSISGSITKSQVSDFTSGTVTTISGSITESQVTNLVTDLAAKAPITYVYTNTSDKNNSFPTATTAISVFGGTATPTFGFTVSVDSTYEYEFYGYLSQEGALSTQTPTWSIKSTAVTLSPVITHVTDFGFTSNTTGLTTTATLSKSRITTGQAMTAITAANVNRYYNVVAKGTIRITGTGTAKIYPALSATVSADNVWSWSAGTLFKLTYVGNGTATAIGTWS
jgi:hypothetical protein